MHRNPNWGTRPSPGRAERPDALTSDRPYRRAFSPQVALELVRRDRGTKLDARVVDALLAVAG